VKVCECMKNGTDILARLHTTPAYESAVLQRIIPEANRVITQLGLQMAAITADKLLHYHIASPIDGIGGSIFTVDYAFTFRNGHIQSVNQEDWCIKVTSPFADIRELAERPSLLDDKSAYDLAVRWLKVIGVDVGTLESKFQPKIFHPPCRRKDSRGEMISGPEGSIYFPWFSIGWGIAPENLKQAESLPDSVRNEFLEHMAEPSSSNCVFVKILGTTRELLELTVNDASLLNRKPLELPNRSDLLGPLPHPRHFVEKLMGGPVGYETVANPDRVEACLITPLDLDDSFDEEDGELRRKRIFEEMEKIICINPREFIAAKWRDRIAPAAGLVDLSKRYADRFGPILVNARLANELSRLLLDFNSYNWGLCSHKGIIEYRVRLKYFRGNASVDLYVDPHLGEVAFVFNGQSHSRELELDGTLASIIESVFPNGELNRYATDEE
jgi:hypothetical protein